MKYASPCKASSIFQGGKEWHHVRLSGCETSGIKNSREREKTFAIVSRRIWLNAALHTRKLPGKLPGKLPEHIQTPARLEFTHVADGKAEFTCRIGTQNAWYTVRHARFVAVHERPPLPTKWYAEREYAGGGTLDAGWAVFGGMVEWFA
ncbi:MAG: hypothetical protein FRX48_02075 [Lasallia pustulata]|uniref:Uncharacterized protein n=1 Tax=Lasallia pustulata TaxID=136370 RepID=A0A5M8PX97_9LECA|nr:MAG: hypothetical protein FRX48_02075 [Lasallia pustulata]